SIGPLRPSRTPPLTGYNNLINRPLWPITGAQPARLHPSQKRGSAQRFCEASLTGAPTQSPPTEGQGEDGAAWLACHLQAGELDQEREGCLGVLVGFVDEEP